MPSPDAIARARQAYFRGDIVRIIGGSAEDMKRLLGVNFGIVHSTGASADSGSVLAIRKTNGVMRQYHAPIGSSGAAWRKAFDTWKDSQTASAGGVGDPPPSAAAWTLIQQNVYSGGGGSGGNTNYTVSIYRLNTMQAQNDFYMVLQDSNVVPNFYPPCYATVIGSCGFWTDHRTFSMSAGPDNVVKDYGPTGTITSESAGFNIGTGLGPDGPGGSVSFGETWSQPSVTTTDHSDHVTAAWREDFTGRDAATPPPVTSTGSFLSHQAAIFQVPFGQSFTLTLANSARFVFLGPFNGNEEGSPDDNTLQVNIPVNPPILSMSPPSLTIAPGQARVASVTATIPGSDQGLSWQLTLQPSGGLAISQTTGSGNANLLLTVEPGQPIGTTWNLNLQTDPPYGAPVVAKNPIIVTVTAGSPPPLALQGILLAGGVSSGEPSRSAEVYDTVNNSVMSIAPLTTARSQHTATVLADGKILIAGGQAPSPTGISATATAEIFDPNTQIFTPVRGATSCPGTPGCMTQARWGHTATLLPDGRVLIAGGADALGGGTTNTAELYDPATQTFTLTGPMATARIFQAAAWIPSEKKVLISGGWVAPFPSQALDSSEYFDPATGQFSPGPTLPVALASPASVSTGPCAFCLIGGVGTGDPINNFSIFSAQTAGWASAGTLNTPRSQFAATPLGTSGLLVTGGSTRDTAGHEHVSATAEVNSLSSNAWQGWKFANNASTCPGAAGCLVTARANHTASVLPDGRILLAGGQDDAGNSLATTEIYDPQSQTFTLGPAMTLSRFSHSATPFHATNVTTKTTLDSSQNPSVYGQPVNFTATVTSTSGAAPDGSVIFNDGSTQLGKVQLTGGSASFKAPALPAGNHSIQAVYSGSDTFAGSTSPAINQVVSMLTPSISAVSSPNPSASGDPVTFTAHVTSSDGTPQGTVDFLDGTTLLKTIPLQDSEARYSTNTLTPGSHAITARYSGDGNYRSVTSSPPVNQTVVVKTQTAVTSSANPSMSGQIVNFTATVTATGSTPVGTVDFIVDSKIVAKNVSVRQGQALYSTGQLAEGNHTVSVVYTPDPASNFSGSTSPTITQSVLNKTTTALTSSVNPSNPGQSVTFRASVTATAGSPTGTVDFLDGVAVIASKVPLTSGSATYSTAALPAGSHSITAVYRPDANTSFSGSTSNPLLQVILSTTSTVVNSSLNPSSYGQSVMFTATVTSASSTPSGGTVTFTDSGVTRGQAPLRNGRAVFSTAALAKGAHAIVASYSGNRAFGASKSPTFTQTVNVTTPLVTLRSSQNPSNQGQLVTFTAAVTGPAGTSPTGAVVFLDGSSRTLGTAPLSGTIANYSTSALSIGTHSVTAAYQGDDNFGPATSQPVSQMVQGAVTCLPATVLLSASPSPSMVGEIVMFTATVNWSDGGTPVGNVTLSETLANGKVKIWGTANLQAGAAVFQVPGLSLGTHRMYATYGGDAPSNHCGATSASLDQQVRNTARRFRRAQSAIPRIGAGHGLSVGIYNSAQEETLLE